MSAAHKNITLWSKCFVCKYPPSKQYFNNLLYLSFWNPNGCPWAWFHRETDDIRTNCFHGFQDKLKESTPLKSLVFWNIVLSRYNTDKGWMLPPPPQTGHLISKQLFMKASLVHNLSTMYDHYPSLLLALNFSGWYQEVKTLFSFSMERLSLNRRVSLAILKSIIITP